MRQPRIFWKCLAAGLFFIFAGFAHAGKEAMQEIFIRGNIAYGNQDYEEAAKAYRSILDEVESVEVHYNLGNALAQTGEWSEAAFHYMRAYSLDPNFEAAQGNLLLAADRLGLTANYPKLPRPAHLLASRYWSIIAAAAFWAAIILYFHPDFISRELPLRKSSALVALALFGVALTAMIQHKLFEDWTVVAQPLVSLRLAPTPESPGESVLIEGDPIRILGHQNSFFHVMTAGGEEGFILDQELYLSVDQQ